MNNKRVDMIYAVTAHVLVFLAAASTLYPFVYVLSMSISDPLAVAANEVLLFPKGFSLQAYERVFMSDEIWMSLYNSLWYTVVGILCMVFVTMLGAYPLSRPRFFAKKFFNLMVVITMFFFAGIIPFYIVVVKVGLYNTRWALIIPYLIIPWNLIVCRTFLQSIPNELYESAKMDGASEFKMLFRITFPLSTPIIAVLALYYGVSTWNGWLAAVLFLSDSKLHPITIFLRRVLISNSAEAMMLHVADISRDHLLTILQVKYAVIIVACLPIFLLYPFVQRYFKRGILLGSLKT